MNGRRPPAVFRSDPVVRVLPASGGAQPGLLTRTVGAPEPPWWRDAPSAVAEVIAALPGLTANTALHFAVGEYCAAAGELYRRRVEARKYRLRPSASTELEPSRLLMVHSAGPAAAHHEAHFHCGGQDMDTAEQAARAALAVDPLGSVAILRIHCSASRFQLTGALMTTAPQAPG